MKEQIKSRTPEAIQDIEDAKEHKRAVERKRIEGLSIESNSRTLKNLHE